MRGAIPLLLLLLAGCTAPGFRPSAETCTAEGWRQAGFAAGKAGAMLAPALADFAAACAPHGPARAAEFEAGHAEGLAAYCTPENAYRLGRARIEPGPGCPAETQVAFDAAWARGFREAPVISVAPTVFVGGYWDYYPNYYGWRPHYYHYERPWVYYPPRYRPRLDSPPRSDWPRR